MRDNRDRIYSGIAEDAYRVALRQYNLDSHSPIDQVLDACEQVITAWAHDPLTKIDPTCHHYANLNSYFFNDSLNLDRVIWIHSDNIIDIPKIISNTLKENLNFSDISVDDFILDPFRPKKEWFIELLVKHPANPILRFIEPHILRQYQPKYTRL